MNNKKTIYITLDIEKDYGTALKEENYYALENFQRLHRFLKKYNIPITIFIQTKILELNLFPKYIITDSIEVELGTHSYSHSVRKNINLEEEIKVSNEIFKSYFGKNPKAFRAPDGTINLKDLKLLKQYGYEYDSSIFPTIRPNRFNYINFKKLPFFSYEDIFEVPFSILSPEFPFPISLSYLKLFGKIYLRQAINSRSTNWTVFGMHLHDLYPPIRSYNKLPPFYKLIYRRNFKKGFSLFKQFVLGNKKRGAKFDILSNLVKKLSSSDNIN